MWRTSCLKYSWIKQSCIAIVYIYKYIYISSIWIRMPFDWHFTKSPQNFSPPRGNKKYASEEWSTERPFSEAKRASHCRCPRSWTLESLASFQTPQRKHKQTNVVFSRDCHKNGLGFQLVSPISPLLSNYLTGTAMEQFSRWVATATVPDLPPEHVHATCSNSYGRSDMYQSYAGLVAV